MRISLSFLITLLVVFIWTNVCGAGEIGFKVIEVQSYQLLKTVNKSTLYQLVLKNSCTLWLLDLFLQFFYVLTNTFFESTAYQWPILLVNLQGTHYQMGYDYGYLLGHESVANYESKNLPVSLSPATLNEYWNVSVLEIHYSDLVIIKVCSQVFLEPPGKIVFFVWH
jgi:hypothetical protein